MVFPTFPQVFPQLWKKKRSPSSDFFGNELLKYNTEKSRFQEPGPILGFSKLLKIKGEKIF